MGDRYKLLEQIGRGGSGVVFKAYDTQLNRYVAVKRLLTAEEYVNDDGQNSDLIREASALATLQHPNIVAVYDLAQEDAGYFIVMELLEGASLSELLRQAPLNLPDFYEFANQCLEAVMTAHQQNILHRDIKPENIKILRPIGSRLQVKIIDFGLARLSYSARKMTEDQSGNIWGSVNYMSPEQIQRHPIDVRSDLYALGCLFYHSLSGVRPFEHPQVQGIMNLHLRHQVKPLHNIAQNVPKLLSDWVMWLMNLNPSDRPENAYQALLSLREIHRAGYFKVTESIPTFIPNAAPLGPAHLNPAVTSKRPQSHRPQPPVAVLPGSIKSSVRRPQALKSNQPGTTVPNEPIPRWVIPAGIAVILLLGFSFWFKSRDTSKTSPQPHSVASTISQAPSPAYTPAARPPDTLFANTWIQLRAGQSMFDYLDTPVQNALQKVHRWKSQTTESPDLIAQQQEGLFQFEDSKELKHPIAWLQWKPHVAYHNQLQHPPQNSPFANSQRRGITFSLLIRLNSASAQDFFHLQNSTGTHSLSLTLNAQSKLLLKLKAKDQQQVVELNGLKLDQWSLIQATWDAQGGQVHFSFRQNADHKDQVQTTTQLMPEALHELHIPAPAQTTNIDAQIAEIVVWPYAMESAQFKIQDWRLSQQIFSEPGIRF